MNEHELWLSEGEEDEEEGQGPTDPSSFTMALTYQGPPGGILCTSVIHADAIRPDGRQIIRVQNSKPTRRAPAAARFRLQRRDVTKEARLHRQLQCQSYDTRGARRPFFQESDAARVRAQISVLQRGASQRGGYFFRV